MLSFKHFGTVFTLCGSSSFSFIILLWGFFLILIFLGFFFKYGDCLPLEVVVNMTGAKEEYIE